MMNAAITAGTAVLIPYRPQALSALIRSSNVSNSIQNCPHFGILMRQLGYAITEGEMAFIRETEEFDQETLHILGNALDILGNALDRSLARRVKSNHLDGRAYGARTKTCLLNTFSLWPNRASGTLIVSSTVR